MALPPRNAPEKPAAHDRRNSHANSSLVIRTHPEGSAHSLGSPMTRRTFSRPFAVARTNDREATKGRREAKATPARSLLVAPRLSGDRAVNRAEERLKGTISRCQRLGVIRSALGVIIHCLAVTSRSPART